jgi:hypothetical protein
LSPDKIRVNINVSGNLNLCSGIHMRCDYSALHHRYCAVRLYSIEQKVSTTAPENTTSTHDSGQKNRAIEMATNIRNNAAHRHENATQDYSRTCRRIRQLHVHWTTLNQYSIYYSLGSLSTYACHTIVRPKQAKTQCKDKVMSEIFHFQCMRPNDVLRGLTRDFRPKKKKTNKA